MMGSRTNTVMVHWWGSGADTVMVHWWGSGADTLGKRGTVPLLRVIVIN